MCHHKELHVREAVTLLLVLLDREEVKDLKAPYSQLSYSLEKPHSTCLQFEPHGYGSDL